MYSMKSVGPRMDPEGNLVKISHPESPKVAYY